MTIDPDEVADDVLDLAKELRGAGADWSVVGVAMLRMAIVSLRQHDVAERKAAGVPALVSVTGEQVQAIVIEAVEFIGARLDDAEADLAERN
jgi:hypothetical protein